MATYSSRGLSYRIADGGRPSTDLSFYIPGLNHDFVIDEEDRVHAEYNGPVQYSSNLNDGNFLHISSSLNEENPLQKESAN